MKYSLLAASAAFLFSGTAHATNGYFPHGYGIKSQGMGGVGIALPQDAHTTATNPAGLGFIEDRADLGFTLFRPQRESEIRGNALGVDGKYEANNTEYFPVPDFGYKHDLTPQLAFGFGIHGHGGMNTDYERPIPLLGTSKPGVDLAQLIVSPALAWKITPRQSIGIALNLAYQRFEAKGLQNFDNPMFTRYPGKVTNNGHDHSFGWGIRVGWIGQVSDQVTLGATYQSKTRMSRFDDYKGLFAEQGDFDIPTDYGIGIAFKATPRLTIAADVQRIKYSEVDSVGRLSLQNLPNGLGSDNGPGFGWRDVTAVKLGVSYAYSDRLTLRAGYDHSSQPIPRSQTFFNMLAPGVVQDHLTLGATWVLANGSELSVAYMRAFEQEVKGANSIPPGFPPAGYGGGEANLKMYEDSIGVAYTWFL